MNHYENENFIISFRQQQAKHTRSGRHSFEKLENWYEKCLVSYFPVFQMPVIRRLFDLLLWSLTASLLILRCSFTCGISLLGQQNSLFSGVRHVCMKATLITQGNVVFDNTPIILAVTREYHSISFLITQKAKPIVSTRFEEILVLNFKVR